MTGNPCAIARARLLHEGVDVSAASGIAVSPIVRRGLTFKVPSRWMCFRILEAAHVPTASIAHSEMVANLAFAIAERINERHPGRLDV
ncbi:MAG: hypothetical protein JSW25_02525, partial [Thermoplasmata archaeon]